MIDLNGKTVLVTGVAGFIGAALCRRIFHDCPDVGVIGVDNMNTYYDVSLKKHRLDGLKEFPGFTFIRGDISDKQFISSVFARYRPGVVVNFAAQASVRYSGTDPGAYIDSNVIGFLNILECCRLYPVGHLIYASSSSVYGNTDGSPSAETDGTDHPASLYAATKKSDELMAYAYSGLYHIPSTGLRFFTVYGPEGRPDMAYFSFTDQLCAGQKIRLYDYGHCRRDFTYIDDIVEGTMRVIGDPPDGDQLCAVYNIGSGRPVEMTEFAVMLAQALIDAGVFSSDFDIRDHEEFVLARPGDVSVTYADMDLFERKFSFRPETPLCDGLLAFAEWYRDHERG